MQRRDNMPDLGLTMLNLDPRPAGLTLSTAPDLPYPDDEDEEDEDFVGDPDEDEDDDEDDEDEEEGTWYVDPAVR